MCFKVGDRVRLVKGTLFVGMGSEGKVVEPFKGQTPPQLFPNRVQFQMGQDVRTVWCGTDELELVDDTRLTTDDSVADGSRDYCSEGGPEDGDAANTAPSDPFLDCTDECRAACKGPEYYYPQVTAEARPDPLKPCPCLTGGPCEVFACDNVDEGPWSEDWEWDGLSQFEEAVVGVFVDAQELLFKKHKDYGPKNISQSPGGPLNGLRVRMHDKLARLNHLVDAGQEPQVLDEKLTDTLLDLANYAIIATLVLKGEWPSE